MADQCWLGMVCSTDNSEKENYHLSVWLWVVHGVGYHIQVWKKCIFPGKIVTFPTISCVFLYWKIQNFPPNGHISLERASGFPHFFPPWSYHQAYQGSQKWMRSFNCYCIVAVWAWINVFEQMFCTPSHFNCKIRLYEFKGPFMSST